MALTEQRRPRFFTRALRWSDWKPNSPLLTQYNHIAIRSHKSACGDHRAAELNDEMRSIGPHYLTEVICRHRLTNCIMYFFAPIISNTILDRFIFINVMIIPTVPMNFGKHATITESK